MTDSLKLTEMQRTSIEFERQRHLANWFIKSSPHMATPAVSTATTATTHTANAGNASNGTIVHNSHPTNAAAAATAGATATATTIAAQQSAANNSKHVSHNAPAPVFFLMSSNGNAGAHTHPHHHIQQHGHSNGKIATTTAAPIMAAGGNCNLTSRPPPPNQSNLPLQLLTPAMAAPTSGAAAGVAGGGGGGVGGGISGLGHLHAIEGRKPKLRRFNSHDTSSNMFSVADFENARLARRNENEMKQRLQRRMRGSANGGCGIGNGGVALTGYSNGCGNASGDYSTGDSKVSKYSNESQHEPVAADVFLDRYSLPRVVRISYKTKFSDETLQSSASSNGSSTVTSHSSASGAGGGSGGGVAGVAAAHNNSHSSTNTTSTGTTSSSASSSGGHLNTIATNAAITPTASAANAHHLESQHEDSGELFLLYRLVRQRHIFHAHNAKTAASNRKKGVLIPQEFPGYFSLINDKGLPTATLYNSLMQLVRERVYKFVSVENLHAFQETQPNTRDSPVAEGCLPLYSTQSPPTPNNRPHYVKTTARSGQVFRLLAVFEDGKQDQNALVGAGCIVGNGSASNKPNSQHGREKEKGRYAQLLNENRQILYVSLATKGKFYEIEPGIPQILQKLAGGHNDAHKKVNPDCVHRITALVSPSKELPQTLRYISGPSGCASAIPETLCITKITTENVAIACPIEDVEMQSPLHLRKLHLTKEMNLLKCTLGFESEQRMLANPNVQNILKFCQFNCDQFLKMVEVELLNRPVRSGSKSRVEGLKLLKPLHLPKLLRREKTTISAHEKEDSIIFLSKSDLASLEAGKTETVSTLEHGTANGNRITDKMKVFQTTKKKWFRKQDKQVIASSNSLCTLELDGQAKRMSMERYSDISKLLQERFGDKPNTQRHEQESISDRSGISELGCSDTETTTLATIEQKLKKFAQSNTKDQTLQKSMSLQDIELISGGSTRKPLYAVDTISEAGTDIEDMENRAPLQQSFITEKLYNEFHVKTKQYSKSSSSLHQLLNFSLPQKLQTHEQKRTMAQFKQNSSGGVPKRLDFNVGEPVTGRRAAGGLTLLAVASNSQNTSLVSPLTPTSLLDDDLPYSSVRDSLILSSPDDEPALGADHIAGNICQALHLIDYTKENIYAEICHDASAMGGIPSSQTRDTFSIDSHTHSTQISDDYGDYASLTYPTTTATTASTTPTTTKSVVGAAGGSAISRVQINCTSSPVSYHTVYLGEQPLGGMQARSDIGNSQRRRMMQQQQREQQKMRDRAHVTTVALEGAAANGELAAAIGGAEAVDNIYNTLK